MNCDMNFKTEKKKKCHQTNYVYVCIDNKFLHCILNTECCIMPWNTLFILLQYVLFNV